MYPLTIPVAIATIPKLQNFAFAVFFHI